ncbi:ABC transporter substrate-binding protein [Planosporangium thailandense]|uniref:ABC transporter substrate-binding protein n=1 Tax=Planosporangium thailandense TaxID=765197 RepID=A0ABX0Y3L8_9ACTN|nr:ABC transporter substrate-binding protein [Planosporangium thailandense]NJC72943.1 ABC transporter substrate-binding protein [Planosporangium thailandense]
MVRRQARRMGRVAVAAVVGAALLLTAACSSSGSGGTKTKGGYLPASARKAANKLVLVASQDPGTLDYVKNNLTALILWLPGNVVEPLLSFDKNGDAQPNVAESWKVSDDQTTYTFKIRDVKFSDGSPVTADDVVYSLETMRKSPITTYSAPYTAVQTIQATGDHEVTVKLSRPSQSFIHGMGGMSALIQPKAAAANIATKPIGTGPYVLDRYVQGTNMIFKANPNYWGKAPSIKEVEVRIMPDGTAALNALRAGEVDAFPVITIDKWERLTKEKFGDTFNLITYPQVGEMLYVTFNATQAPYNNPALRKALAETFNRQQFIDAFNAPWGAKATCGYGLDNTSWFEKESKASCPAPFDTAAAKNDLKAAGYNGEELEFASLSDVPDLSLPADLLIQQLNGSGVKVKRDAITLARYSQQIFQQKPPQFGITVMSDPAPITQFACADQSQMGWTTYCSPEMTDLMNKADAAKTKQEYEDLMKQADDVLKKDAVIVPLLSKSGVGLLRPDLKGWQEPKILVDIDFANLHW